LLILRRLTLVIRRHRLIVLRLLILRLTLVIRRRRLIGLRLLIRRSLSLVVLSSVLAVRLVLDRRPTSRGNLLPKTSHRAHVHAFVKK
jgi:hypothetical protein